MDQLRSSAADRKKFFTKLAFYEEGEKKGRLLAKIARSQQQSPAIGVIHSSSGQVVNSPAQIISELASFDTDTYSDADLDIYLSAINLPSLSNMAMQQLEVHPNVGGTPGGYLFLFHMQGPRGRLPPNGGLYSVQ